MFWDEIWELMRLTYNRKYPNQEISKSDMELTRRKIGHLALQNRGKDMTFEHFFAEFGDELGADLFWFGFYGTDTELTNPWEERDNKEGSCDIKDVKVNYSPMMEQEAEKIKKEQEAEKIKEEAEKLEKERSKGIVAWITNVIASCWNLFCYPFSFFYYIYLFIYFLIF